MHTATLTRHLAVEPDAAFRTVSALGQTWSSRSRLVALDRDARRFSYRSAPDDANPSYAEWTWTVAEAPGGCEVAVTWALNPETFWRRALLGAVGHG